MPTRAQRNNNPGNIDRSQVPWLGEDRSEAARAQEGRFCVFLDPKYGYRALGKVLLTYQDIHGLHTVAGLIGRWAPAVENKTSAYVAAVSKAISKAPDQRIDLSEPGLLRGIVKAIAHHESGTDPFPDAVLDQGMALLGLAPETTR